MLSLEDVYIPGEVRANEVFYSRSYEELIYLAIHTSEIYDGFYEILSSLSFWIEKLEYERRKKNMTYHYFLKYSCEKNMIIYVGIILSFHPPHKYLLPISFCAAAELGYERIVSRFLEYSNIDPSISPSNPSINDDRAALVSAEKGYIDVLQILLKDERIDISNKSNQAIRWASCNGHFEVVKVLLENEKVDPSDTNNEAIRWAACKGHVEIVKILLADERVDPSTNDNEALRWSCRHGHIEVVKLLLFDPRVDVNDKKNQALEWSIEYDKPEVEKILREHLGEMENLKIFSPKE